MRDKIPFLLAAGIIPFAASAFGQDSKFYLSGGVGAAFEQGVRIKGADIIDFHNGVRGDAALGYKALDPWISVELASGGIWNAGDKIGGVAIDSFSGSLDLYQIPIMGNLVLSTPYWHGLKPYLGAGVGGTAAFLQFKRPLGSIRDMDFVFSYQFMGGLTYKISEHVDLSVDYKFFQTGDHSWEENSVFLKTEGTTVHSVSASLIWKF